MEGQNYSVKERLEQLETFMGKYTAGGEDLCVAFSGGVDSSLILKAAVKAATKDGSKVFLVNNTFYSNGKDLSVEAGCTVNAYNNIIAKRVAAELGGVHKVIHVNELEQEAIRMNPVNRCYLCKKHLFVNLKEMAKSLGAETVMDGTNEDDHHVYRPGIQALKELGIVSPLAQLHITKAEVKAMAKEWGISVASRPSTPCMATRLPYNTPIDYDVMKQIEAGEGYLRELLGGNVRLRLHGNVVRIEADKTSFGKLLEHGDEIVKTLKNLGFVYITMDLEGFRSGSMDVGLDK